MSKHYLSKSGLLLSLLVAAGLSQTVKADEVITSSPSQPETTSSLVSTEASTESSQATSDTQPIPVTSEETSTAALSETAETASSVTAPVATAPLEGQTVDVRILSTTDLHTNLVNYDYYQDKPSQTVGLAKTAVLLEEAKKENSNVVLVDNGDTIQGTPLGTYKSIVDPIEAGEQHPMYAALELLGFDAGTLGNHEFNYGLDYLHKVIATADIPLVNANVLDAKTNQPLFKTYEILTKTFTDTEGRSVALNIGITGIVPPQILSWDKAHLEGKVTVQDAVEAVTKIVPTMRQAGADLVLVLSHSGIGDDVYEKGEENVGYQIAGIEGVDAVVTGHSHAEFPSGKGTGFYEKYAGVDGVNGLINGTPVTMAGKYGDHLGLIDLGLTYTDGKWQVTSSKAQIRKIDTKSTVADSSITDLAKEAHEGTVAYVRQQVGTTTAPITSYFALVKDDPSVQIVNNAQLWYVKQELAGTPEGNLPLLSAAAPFKAGARGDATAYTDIPAGPIAIKNVADLYLYDNVTAILKITGADLREWLEMSAGQFNTIDPTKTEAQNLVNTDYRTYNFDVIDGVTYQYDITQPNKYDRSGKLVNETASRVRNLQYQGKDVTNDQEFIVVTNNYRASGSFPGVKNASLNRLLNLENRQAIINYILAEKTINPSADGNWTFTDSIKGLDLRFLTADRAQSLVAGDASLIYLQTSSTEGFGEFKFVYTEPKQAPSPQPIPAPQTQGQGQTQAQSAEIYKIVKTAYQETLASQANPTLLATKKQGLTSDPATSEQSNTKTLPNTSSKETGLMSLFGLSLLGLAGLMKRKQD